MSEFEPVHHSSRVNTLFQPGVDMYTPKREKQEAKHIYNNMYTENICRLKCIYSFPTFCNNIREKEV